MVEQGLLSRRCIDRGGEGCELGAGGVARMVACTVNPLKPRVSGGARRNRGEFAAPSNELIECLCEFSIDAVARNPFSGGQAHPLDDRGEGFGGGGEQRCDAAAFGGGARRGRCELLGGCQRLGGANS